MKKLLNSEGENAEDFVNEDCPFCCVCIAASSGLFIDSLLFPVYCVSCVATYMCCPPPPKPVEAEEDTNKKFRSSALSKKENIHTEQPKQNTENPAFQGKK